MAVLIDVVQGEPWTPPCEVVVGRSPLCTRQLEGADVSNEHASLRWNGTHWELRDLNSRNGTFAGGERLGPGQVADVVAGMTIRFGASGVFEVPDDSPPPPMARRAEDGRWVIACSGLLALPDETAPSATVHLDTHGRWLLEQGGQAEAVAHADAVTITGQTWRLFLPNADLKTAEPPNPELALRGVCLQFVVSRDEEHVQLFAITPSRRIDLKARAHHYVLLTLARSRQHDREAGVPEPEQGWIYYDALARMLSTERTHVNVAVYRLRKQLQETGFVDAAACVERRLSTGQLRIGVARFEIA